MAPRFDAPGARLTALWRRLSPYPGGSWLFSRILGLMVPYTATFRPQVRRLEAGYARVEMSDRRAVRNHLGSIHAVALANLGELASGLALMSGLPADIRGIPTSLTSEYLKKARGHLVAECHAAIPTVTAAMDQDVVAVITDPAGDAVARVTARWRLSPIP